MNPGSVPDNRITLPLVKIDPERGLRDPNIERNKVVFPDPFLPISPIVSPSETDNERPFSALNGVNVPNGCLQDLSKP